MLDAMMGLPAAMASSSAMDKPSRKLGRTTRSAGCQQVSDVFAESQKRYPVRTRRDRAPDVPAGRARGRHPR